MRGELIVHIGPPKTATTSLQHYWTNLNISGFKYLGIIQPRGSNSLANKLYDYVSIKTDDKLIAKELVESIEEALFKYEYVVISEEMFVLEQSKASYLQKLRILYRVIAQFQPVVTYCFRSAEQVYFSYYIEIFKALPRELQNSFEKFQESKYSDCYKYKKMYGVLSHLGFENINIFFFKDLVAGKLTMNDILGIDDPKYKFKVELVKKNITVQKNKDLKVEKKSNLRLLLSHIASVLPNKIKGSGLGILFLKITRDKSYTNLNEKSITQNIYDENMNDISFIKDVMK